MSTGLMISVGVGVVVVVVIAILIAIASSNSSPNRPRYAPPVQSAPVLPAYVPLPPLPPVDLHRFRSESQRVTRNVEQRRIEVQTVLTQIASTVNVGSLKQIWLQSVRASDDVYNLYNSSKQDLDAFASTKSQAERHLAYVKASRGDTAAATQLIQSMSAHYQEVAIQRNTLLAAVKNLNNNTHALKVKIRDSGPDGYIWYQELEARTAKKRQPGY